MKRACRKNPTVLDQLEDEGIINEKTAAELRTMWKHKDAPWTDAEEFTLGILHYAIMQPARGDTRVSIDRLKAMAIERAVYKSYGLPDATARTARKWGVTPRTVNNAVRNYPFSLPAMKRDRAAPEILEAERKRLEKPARRIPRK